MLAKRNLKKKQQQKSRKKNMSNEEMSFFLRDGTSLQNV